MAGIRGEDAGRSGLRLRGPRADRALRALDRRARGGARPRHAPVGPALPRADGRPVRSRARRAGRCSLVAAVSSGTAGLHLCMRLTGHRAGRRGGHHAVFLRRLANCALYEGAGPCSRTSIRAPSTSTRPPSRRRSRRDRRRSCRCISSGIRPSWRSSRRLAARHGLAIVEDACEALGSGVPRPAGWLLGHPSVFAFYPNKQMTTGEGGAVAVASEEDWALLKSLSNQGRSDSGEWLTHSRLGYNYRLDDLSAALGLAQLERFDEILASRALWRPATGAARRRRGGRGAACGRRRPPPLLVRVRRHARVPGSTGTA